jgi:hypothetical protein
MLKWEADKNLCTHLCNLREKCEIYLAFEIFLSEPVCRPTLWLGLGHGGSGIVFYHFYKLPALALCELS